MSEPHADGERLTLAEQILQLNDHLEETARASSNQAFALALTAGLIPAGIFVLVVFMLLKRSLVGALFSAILMLLALVVFANLAAYITRARVARRVVEEVIAPQIAEILTEYQITRQEFDLIAGETLEQNALLCVYGLQGALKTPADARPPASTEEGKV